MDYCLLYGHDFTRTEAGAGVTMSRCMRCDATLVLGPPSPRPRPEHIAAAIYLPGPTWLSQDERAALLPTQDDFEWQKITPTQDGVCDICHGSRQVWDPDDGTGSGAGIYRPCLACHVCTFTEPVYKLSHFGGTRALCMKCSLCGTWEGRD